MTALVMALYAEAPTDAHFLPPIAQRTAVQILSQRGRGGIVDVLESMCLSVCQGATRAERILHAAKQQFVESLSQALPHLNFAH